MAANICRSSAAGLPPFGWGGRAGIKGRARSQQATSLTKVAEDPLNVKIYTFSGKQGNDLIVHSERFFLCTPHVQVSDLGWLEKGHQHSLCAL
jgi:hypothetical protein